MPWYLSFGRVLNSLLVSCGGAAQLYWILEAEDRYKRSLLWKPTVAVITDHKLQFAKLGASRIEYEFKVKGQKYGGSFIKSGGIYEEEFLRNPQLLGVGTEIVVYYNPDDPGKESAVKLTTDRQTQALYSINVLVSAFMSYRLLRCETVIPQSIYRALSMNRRMLENTGLRGLGTQASKK